MITKQNFYNLLICLTLVSFGFFGSLSHLFSLTLIIFVFANYKITKQKNAIEFNAKIVFSALAGCFFLFLFTSIFRSDFSSLLHSLSPMLPLPLIGLLIIFHRRANLELSSKKIAQFSQIAVLFSLIIYFFLSMSADPNSIYYIFDEGRLMLLSGNPIPFSFVMLGISIFCLSDWRNSTNTRRTGAFVLFILGAYFAGFLSGTRGTLLSLLVIFPIIIFYLFNRFTITFFVIVILAPIILLLFQTGAAINLNDSYFNRIKNALETLTLLENIDNSIWLRLEMWSATIKVISDAPIFGFGITERFNALIPHLNSSFGNFTHPHNDILASVISSGFLGSVTALISIMSGFIAALLSPHWSSKKVLLGLMISIPTFITANVSTVFFNDITSAWLAFSAYLIFAIDFKDNKVAQPKPKRSLFKQFKK